MIDIQKKWNAFHEKYSLIADSASYYLSNFGNSVFGFLFWVFAGRLISSEIVGISSAIISTIYLIGNIGILGLNSALTIELPKINSKREKDALISKGVILVGSAGILIAILYAFIPLFPGKPESFFENKRFVLSLALICGLWSIHLLSDQVLIALKHGELTLQKNWGFSISRILFLLATIWILGEKYAIVGATGIGILIALIITFISSRKINLWTFKFAAKSEIKLLKLLFPTSLKFYIANILAGLNLFILPSIVLDQVNANAAAYFYVCWMIANMANIGPAAIGIGAFTEGARQGMTPNLIKKSIKYILLISIPTTAGLLLLAPWVLLIYSPEYAQHGTDLLRLLSIAVIPFGFMQLNFSIMQVQERLNALIFSSFLLSLIIIFGSIYLIPIYGIEGIGISRIFSYLIVGSFAFIINLPVFRSILKKHPKLK